ncbi:MAG: type II toxin-antitoxin system mRNA interferase toxin, RelE/StbE family [Candidatus Brocadiaceae bacterium]|nr:type II toxin-antitoxin system mRNA interferase toxin, RelE/StbE family [Candidatus Brocadiaceae bacterium]
MLKISFSSSFKRAFKKKIKGKQNIENKFWEKVNIFINDPYNTQLRTHKLSGKLEELWSFTVEYDVRVIFYFSEKDKVVFVAVGKHDEVY